MTRADLHRRRLMLKTQFRAGEIDFAEYQLLRRGADLAYFEGQPQRRRARRAVQSALKASVLAKPARCALCGAPGAPDAHHQDYAKPLIVKWLCADCHYSADSAMTGRQPFRRGSTVLTSGWWTSRMLEAQT